MAEHLDRLTAALRGRYEIKRELGRGGMATVYLADDVKHQRAVAVKLMRPEVAAALGVERFLVEIGTAAHLTHPHILPLYDSGEADGLLYYVSPYIEGETLRGCLQRERQLPLDVALQIAREVGDALSYAHTRGIVHRDVKPENILLSSGHAILADFGLARAVAAAGGPHLTATGVAVGTASYMSPEQAGAGEVDGRSDVYSLGCVTYEMLVGEPPYGGQSTAAIIARHLAAPVPSVRTTRATVPESVDRAITKALAKVPADRFTTVGQFVDALRAETAPSSSRRLRVWTARATGAAVLVGIVLLARAVLDRVAERNRSSAAGAPLAFTVLANVEGSADEGLRLTVRELIRSAVEQSGRLVTTTREQITQGLAFAGKPETAEVDVQLARELAIRGSIPTVLAPRLERVGGSYSLSVTLLDADSAEVILAEAAMAPKEDDLIPTVDAVVRRLRTRLGEKASAVRGDRDLDLVATPSLEAYRKYAHALRTFWRGSGSDRDALQLYQEAVAIDPEFASAWFAIGVHYMNMGILDSADLAYTEALSKPDRLSEREALSVEGVRSFMRWDLPTAHRALRRLAERYGTLHHNLAVVLENLGRNDEALALYRRAGGPFPHSGISRRNEVRTLIELGRAEEAWPVIQQFSGEIRAAWLLRFYAATGDWSHLDSVARAIEADPTLADTVRAGALAARASVHAVRGEVRAARALLGRAISLTAGDAGATRAAEHLHILLSVVSDEAPPPLAATTTNDTTPFGLVHRALHAARSGDTVVATRLLQRLQGWGAESLRHVGSAARAVEGLVAAQAGRWPAIVDLVGPTVGWSWPHRASGGSLVYVNLVRWLLADAYEHLGRPDSAVVYLNLIATPASAVQGRAYMQSGFVYSFAQRRLVPLCLILGRVDEAARHRARFLEAFTNPDPPLAQLRDALPETREPGDR